MSRMKGSWLEIAFEGPAALDAAPLRHRHALSRASAASAGTSPPAEADRIEALTRQLAAPGDGEAEAVDGIL